jgi:hypothetical protein
LVSITSSDNSQEDSHFKRNCPESQLSKEPKRYFQVTGITSEWKILIENDSVNIVEELLNKFTLNWNTIELKRYDESL